MRPPLIEEDPLLMFVVIAVGAVCLASGLLTGTVFLLWLALGLGVVATAVFGRLTWSGRRARVATAEATEVPVEPTLEPEPEARVADEVRVDDEARVGDGVRVDDEVRVADEVRVDDGSSEEARPSEATSWDAADPAPDEPHAIVDTGTDGPGVGGRTTGGTPPGTVRVVPGRRRFHLEDCRLIAGKPAEEIGLEEALEEGFTACTACIPHRDETLGAR